MGIHRETSGAILIDSFGRLLFQQRDNPEILYPGMIGFFGGHREIEETFLDCVARRNTRRDQLFCARRAVCAFSQLQGNGPRGHLSFRSP
jgi:hypothetical protein